jgi:hypothetical protein
MSGDWIDSLRCTLDGLEHDVEIFVRNDDVGWSGDRLEPLLDLFEHYQIPIDLAVIPAAIDVADAARLDRRISRSPVPIGLHQHGFDHSNHQPQGRKCEFGGARSAAQQFDDLERGQRRLHSLFDSPIDSIFTPPWNRCNADTVACLHELGLQTLSRDLTAESLPGTLRQLPVTLDWQRSRNGCRLTAAEVGAELVRQLAGQRRIGIMLHHQTMAAADYEHLREVFSVTLCYKYILWKSMRAISGLDAGRLATSAVVASRAC